eukprot:TRINITY_DN226_c0_g1_i1.p2 TRINITY_DN226_c0_g1~~TRINITY_DN226_c0_g1_i1.p2  ORF type:complete len:116 (+),score=2.02 TRINITY_DN226_c0_g1_i1:427-774(+)
MRHQVCNFHTWTKISFLGGRDAEKLVVWRSKSVAKVSHPTTSCVRPPYLCAPYLRDTRMTTCTSYNVEHSMRLYPLENIDPGGDSTFSNLCAACCRSSSFSGTGAKSLFKLIGVG